MDHMSSPDASLVWLWILEYLASFQEIDVSILHDVVEMAPDFANDLGKQAREMVALRSLEEIFGTSNSVANDIPYASVTKVEFDLSASCEDVLEHILHETSISDLKKGGLELFKWDVTPFIMHKRANMPKCALEQLKDAILEGTHPAAASLREVSGLECTNEREKMHVDNDDRNALSCRPHRIASGSQTMAGEGNSIPVAPENENGISEAEAHNRNLLSSETDRIGLATERLSGVYTGMQDSSISADILHISSMKLKQDTRHANQSVGQTSLPVHGTEILADNSRRIGIVTEEGGADLAEDYQAGCVKESRLSEGGNDACAALRLEHNSDVNNNISQDSHVEFIRDTHQFPHVTHGDGPVCNVMVSETNDAERGTLDGMPSASTRQNHSVGGGSVQDDFIVISDGSHHKTRPFKDNFHMEHLCEEEMLNDNDKYHKEMIDVSTNKSRFLTSQCILNDNFLGTTDWAEQNLCVKCKKDGKLLVCSVMNCPLAVHEDCLGSSAFFDEKGLFYCPFCAYSHAISEYLDCKEELSLAQKELAALLRMGLKLPREGEYHSRQSADETLSAKIFDNVYLRGRGNNQTRQNGQDVNETGIHQLRKNIHDKQQPDPFVSCSDVILLPFREAEVNVVETDNVPIREGIMVQECPSIREHEGMQDQGLVVPGCEEKSSEGENDKHVISNYSVRPRKRDKKYTFPPIPQRWRKKLPWTAKEEEMLKEGVSHFSSGDDKIIPWKKILEFGASVFQRGRTPVDLKDKWRNLCKGSPGPK